MNTDFIKKLSALIGDKYVLTGADTQPFSEEWTEEYHWTPIAVVRPADTAQVSQIVTLCAALGIAMVPTGGKTGLAGGLYAQDALMISLDRLNKIRAVKTNTKVAIVEAGVILQDIHDAVEPHDLIFPLFFGARGSAMIGGNLSTNAGGSNVLRYGNTRDLCLGLEVVLPDGRIMNLMSELRKDNTGLDLRQLFIGAEGTLGIITAAVLKLYRKPLRYVTAMVGLNMLEDALPLLAHLQKQTGGGVEAFEYMPRSYVERHLAKIEGAKEPFDAPHAVNILLEIASTRPMDAQLSDSGSAVLDEILENALTQMLESGAAQDAVIAQNEAQRRTMWARREAAAELLIGETGKIDTDVSVPLESVPTFLAQISKRVKTLDKAAEECSIAHLGDGNLHYTVIPSDDAGDLKEVIVEAVEDVVLSLGGSFSAEHGIGLSKLNSMRRRKDPAALDVMWTIKQALDPQNLMNPGKVYPQN